MTGRASSGAVTAATVGAAVMIANQVAGKATRDALFLSHFPISDLPTMLIVGSLLSLTVVLGVARLMAARGPANVIPVAFGISASLWFGEWALYTTVPRVVAVSVYLHVAALGAVLISGFWSMVNERFDPHTAKKNIGKIAGGATLGGLIGGLAAERVAALASLELMLPGLAVLHVVCAVAVWQLRDPGKYERHPDQQSAWKTLGRNSYLRNIALLVFLITLSTNFIDFVFKASAAGRYSGEDLLRFFALFYTGISALTFVIQAALSRVALEKLGLARTVSTLPVVLLAGGLGVIALPGLFVAGAAFASASVLHGSLYRSGYELLYTPIAANDKRGTKTIIDVGVDRIADAMGGGIVRLIIFVLAPAIAIDVLMGAAAAFGLIAVIVAVRLHAGYVRALEASLINRAGELDIATTQDSVERNTIMQTVGALNLSQALGVGRSFAMLTQGMPVRESIQMKIPIGLMDTDAINPVPGTAAAASPAVSAGVDTVVARIAALRSGDADRVRRALAAGEITPALAGQVIPLLAWDEVSSDAIAALEPIADLITGQLVDALTNPNEEFAIRRRVPRVLASATTQRAANGLFAAVRDDTRFEVRVQAGRALVRVCDKDDGVSIDSDAVCRAVKQEVEVDRRVWNSRRLLDGDEASMFGTTEPPLNARTNWSLEHVFTLLMLVLPRQPLKIAFRGLQTDDATLRGTALEYLDSVLPTDLRDAVRKVLAAEPARAPVSSNVALDRLMKSRASIELNLDLLRERLLGAPAGEEVK